MTSTADMASEQTTQLAGPGEGWFVYGVVGAEADLPSGLSGLDGKPVTTLTSGPVAAVVTAATFERPPGRGADLLAYHSTLDALAHSGAVVPVRFGSMIPDERVVVEEFLAPDADYFRSLLENLAGRSQFSFQASYHEQVVLSEIVTADPEIAELRERTRQLPEEAAYGERVRLGELVAHALEGKREADAGMLLDAVLPLVDDEVVRPVSGLERVLDAALLVDGARRAEFEDRLESLAEAVHERMRLRLMGPTAPYDFVGGV